MRRDNYSRHPTNLSLLIRSGFFFKGPAGIMPDERIDKKPDNSVPFIPTAIGNVRVPEFMGNWKKIKGGAVIGGIKKSRAENNGVNRLVTRSPLLSW